MNRSGKGVSAWGNSAAVCSHTRRLAGAIRVARGQKLWPIRKGNQRLISAGVGPVLDTVGGHVPAAELAVAPASATCGSASVPQTDRPTWASGIFDKAVAASSGLAAAGSQSRTPPMYL